ncbi:MAG: efflux RND transporter periplasmic adaptor subunit [Tepidisphaeraceae bacterium]
MLIVLRKFSFYLAVLGMVATILLVLKMRPNFPVVPPPVTPATKPVMSAIAAAGLVEARHENTRLGVPAAALLSELKVKVWDRVKVGQVLFKLDGRDLQAQLSTNLANVAVAEATLNQVIAKFKRVEKLTAGQVSSEEWQERKDNVALAQAQLDYARAAVEQTKVMLDRLTVTSPIDATVLQVNVRVGEYIQPGQSTSPIVVGETEELQIRADVDEQLAPRVRPGDDAVGYVKGDSTQPIPLKFVRIEPFITPKVSLTGSSNERVDTRVLQVIFSFKQPADRRVYVGQQMDVYVNTAPTH